MNLLRLGLLTAATSSLLAACTGDDDDPPIIDTTSTLYTESTVDVLGGSGTTTLVTVQDRGEGTGTTTWTNDRTYQLDGFVFVNEGQTLTIEAGTVIRGNEGEGESSSALIVARGGTIDAVGTAEAPIVFTSASDNSFSTPDGLVQGTNLAASEVGLWGGLIVLGRAGLNSAPGESAIEGIVTTEARGLYGGDDDGDDSGTLRYVSIRHGGTEIGAGNEINGLTLGGVGSGTDISYVEVFGNQDDGIEFFGGTVNTKYLVSAYCQDDAFDYDEGYRGSNQFWLAVQRGDADRGGEHDGGTDPETAQPFATPTIANASFYGLGADGGKRLITFRDNAGGKYYNSLFTGYGRGVDVEYLGDESVIDSYDRLLAGDLAFANNLLWEVGGEPFVISAPEEGVEVPQADLDFGATYFSNAENTTATDPGFGADGLTPAAGGAAQTTSFFDLTGAFFDDVDYKGAIDPDAGPDWIAGWTRLSQELD